MIGLTAITGEIGTETFKHLIKLDMPLCLLLRQPEKISIDISNSKELRDQHNHMESSV